MAASIPTIEPSEIRRGDTIPWTITVDDYSSDDGWALTYYFRGPTALDVTATAIAGGDFGVTIAAGTTSSLIVGNYWWTKRVSKSGEIYTVGNGQVDVLQNLAEEMEYDGRTTAQQCLDSIEAVLKNRASRSDVEREIQAAGRRIKELTPEELITWHNYFKDIVERENKEKQIADGDTGVGYIHIRFL